MHGCCKQSMLYLTEHSLDISLHHIMPSNVSTLLILSLKEKSCNSYVFLYLIALQRSMTANKIKLWYPTTGISERFSRFFRERRDNSNDEHYVENISVRFVFWQLFVTEIIITWSKIGRLFQICLHCLYSISNQFRIS